MNTLIALSAIVACAFAAQLPQQPNQVIQILKQSQDVNPDGSYQYSYETENGISAQEQGQLKNVGSEEPAMEAQGSYQYTAPDGTPISVQYIANELGFQPQGAHIPTPHPIPEYILRSLEYNAAHPEPEVPAHKQGHF